MEHLEQPKRQYPAFNAMAICGQRHAKFSKQATLLGGVDVGLPKWCVCGCGFDRFFVHEGVNDISNVKVHLKTHSGNVNIPKSHQNCPICKSQSFKLSRSYDLRHTPVGFLFLV